MGARFLFHVVLVTFTCLLVSSQQHWRRQRSSAEDFLQPNCGYKTCGSKWKDGMLNVHLVPHTHDDVGWLKTVDQYFMGLNNSIQNAGVQYIIDSVVESLQKDANRRFIYVETAFFKRWWKQQDEETQNIVKGLVNEGRLEFILGAWSMNDEASTHYNAIIDNHALGLKFLLQNFGTCGIPRTAWQIDPFGHSKEQAALFALMGYDSLFFGRLDYQDKERRLFNKTMEMVWHASDSLGQATDLFTGALPNSYNPPTGFNWDILVPDAPIQDDERLTDYNVDVLVKNFISAAQAQAKDYATSHIIMTMGSDFQYQSAHHWYKNLDKLIKYVNAEQAKGSKVNVFYSTPSCYTFALNSANQVWPAKSDDFFPYASEAAKFWTGYFTSRPTLKGFVRDTNKYLQVVKQLQCLAQIPHSPATQSKVQPLLDAMGIAQHHDAVSGTEKQHVADDYAMRLALGRATSLEVINEALGKFMGLRGPADFVTCDYLNISACDITEKNTAVDVMLYNPIARPVSHYVRLPVVSQTYSVKDSSGADVPVQILPISSETRRIPGRTSDAEYEVLFKAQLPPLGYAIYTLHKSATAPEGSETITSPLESDGSISNENIELMFSGESGELKRHADLKRGVSVEAVQKLLFYRSYGNSSSGTHSSGAYVFRPNGTETYRLDNGTSHAFKRTGALVEEIRQHISPWASQVYRVYQDQEQYSEIEWTIGPIPVEDNVGKEVISHFLTSLKTDSLYYTDANGRQMLQRKRDYRATWKLNQTEPISGNYYPVNSRMYIKDAENQLTILTDRSQGGASIHDGEMEIMLHRRCLHDDGLGVGENLNETAYGKGLVARGVHRMIFNNPEESTKLHRQMAEEMYMAPLVLLAPATDANIKRQWTSVGGVLPENVHLLTLEDYNNTWGGYIVRLEHLYESDEHPVLSKPATVSLKSLFSLFTITSAEELTLAANQKLNDLHRLQWKSTQSANRQNVTAEPLDDDLNVVLHPMQIRTFVIRL